MEENSLEVLYCEDVAYVTVAPNDNQLVMSDIQFGYIEDDTVKAKITNMRDLFVKDNLWHHAYSQNVGTVDFQPEESGKMNFELNKDDFDFSKESLIDVHQEVLIQDCRLGTYFCDMKKIEPNWSSICQREQDYDINKETYFDTLSDSLIEISQNKGDRDSSIRLFNEDTSFLPDVREFDRSSVLYNHVSNRPYNCNVCQKTFTHGDKLFSHLRAHTGEKTALKFQRTRQKVNLEEKDSIYPCNICGKILYQLADLDNHINCHLLTERKSHVCKYCNKSFLQETLLKEHIRFHAAEKVYRCEYCQKKFTQNAFLKIHLRSHTGEKPYHCPLCPRSFTLHSNLNEHIRVHTGEKPFVCSYCNKRFRNHSTWGRHLRIHTGERPFQCQHCEKSFTQKTHLITHLLTHRTDNKLECKYCMIGFDSQNELDSHTVIHTSNCKKPYQCRFCFKTFAERSYLSTHVTKYHKQTDQNDFTCQYCFRTFAFGSELRKHVEIHIGVRPYECYICHKHFTSAYTLKNHVAAHAALKIYVCDTCERKFFSQSVYRSHIAKHTAYTCYYCNKSFPKKVQIRQHIRNAHRRQQQYDVIEVIVTDTDDNNINDE